MGEKPAASLVVVLSEGFAEESMLATCVPEKAKKRNMVVPTNSPIKATKSVAGCFSKDKRISAVERTYGSSHYFPSRLPRAVSSRS